MEWIVLLLLFFGLCVLLSLLLPQPPPSRWRRGMEKSADRLAGRFRRRAVPAPDPFDTLRLQTRLGHLAGEIQRIETAPRVYARAHRLMAVEAAYDDLLDEACRLAGVPAGTDLERGEQKRRHEEQELAARGWSW
ncbi:hypothetical protein [Kribbella sp. CA-247076]|uniref:hypothetical protein n=1 Tax=Kribbella sp. CA-247076 TaxID=3239941 RepID=UPI003D8EA6E4